MGQKGTIALGMLASSHPTLMRYARSAESPMPHAINVLTNMATATQPQKPGEAMSTQEILNHLLKQVDAGSPAKPLQRTEETVEEVIFESDIDGTRYCLVRCFPRSKSQIRLSPREQGIARLVSQGLPNKSIAKRLDISPWTVATHLRRIFGKLGVSSRTAMIAQLLEQNLL